MTPPRLVSARPAPPKPEAAGDRRQHGPRADQLRRELRAADERLYAREHPIELPALPSAAPSPSRRVWPGAVAVAAALLLIAMVFGMTRPQRATTDPRRSTTVALAPHANPRAPLASAPGSGSAAVAAPRAARTPTAATNRPEPTVTTVAERHTRALEGDAWLVPSLDIDQRPVFSPSFASNGSAVFFHTGATGESRSALMTASDAGDQLRVMTILDDGARNYHVQPSPDGRLIAFDSDRDGDRGVYVANRDGTEVHRVSGPGYAAVPTWSPDGTKIAFERAEKNDARVWNLWLLTLASGQTDRLTEFRYGQPWSASWFPDGQRIAYTHADQLYIRDLTSGHTQSYATPVPGHFVRTPVVSPDGARIIFQVYRNGAWLLDMSDGSMRCVLQDPTAEEFAWAPDGHRVAFHSRRDGQWGIYVMARQ